MKDHKTRIQFDLTPEAVQRLEALMSKVGVMTRAELFRLAFFKLEDQVEEREKRKQI